MSGDVNQASSVKLLWNYNGSTIHIVLIRLSWYSVPKGTAHASKHQIAKDGMQHCTQKV